MCMSVAMKGKTTQSITCYKVVEVIDSKYLSPCIPGSRNPQPEFTPNEMGTIKEYKLYRTIHDKFGMYVYLSKALADETLDDFRHYYNKMRIYRLCSGYIPPNTIVYISQNLTTAITKKLFLSLIED
jgi:hypothetical protein